MVTFPEFADYVAEKLEFLTNPKPFKVGLHCLIFQLEIKNSKHQVYKTKTIIITKVTLHLYSAISYSQPYPPCRL